MERRPRNDNLVGVNVFFFFEITLATRGLPGFLLTLLVLEVGSDFFRLAEIGGSS